MIRHYLFLVSLSLIGSVALSQSTDSILVEIKMKDGTVQKGRIVEQLPGPNAVMETVDGKRVVVGRTNSENLEIDLDYLHEALKTEREQQRMGENTQQSSPFTSFRFGYGTTASSLRISVYERTDYTLDNVSVSLLSNTSTPVLSFESNFHMNNILGFYFNCSISNYESESDYINTQEHRVDYNDSLLSRSNSSRDASQSMSSIMLSFGGRISTTFGSNPVHPYFSFGFLKNFASYEKKSYQYPQPSIDRKNNLNDVLGKLYSYSGIETSVGADYQFNSSLALYGEYKLRFIGSEATLEGTRTENDYFYDNGILVNTTRTTTESNEIKYSYWIDQVTIGLIFYIR